MKLILTIGLLSFLTACGQKPNDTKETESRENKMTREQYLDKNIFYGLTNINDGFDAEGIKYFSEKDFDTILDRVKKLGLGIKGIEPWQDGEYYGVEVYEDYTKDPTDSNWYMKSFDRFKKTGDTLQYAATYHIPDKFLEKINE